MLFTYILYNLIYWYSLANGEEKHCEEDEEVKNFERCVKSQPKIVCGIFIIVNIYTLQSVFEGNNENMKQNFYASGA